MHWRLLLCIVVILQYLFFSFLFLSSSFSCYQLIYSATLPCTVCTLPSSPPARPPLLLRPLFLPLFPFPPPPCQIAVESASQSVCFVSGKSFFYLPSTLILFLFLYFFTFVLNFYADHFPKREQREKNSHPLRGTG